MSKIIRVESCNVCPYKDYKSTSDYYIPVCNRMCRIDLPYNVFTDNNGKVIVRVVGIPPECPLENDE